MSNISRHITVWLASSVIALSGHSSYAQAAGATALVDKLTWAAPKDGQAAIEAIAAKAPAAVVNVASLLREPGKGDDAKARFALHGVALQAAAGKSEAVRQAVTQGLVSALSAAPGVEVKAFLVRQLQIVGKDEAVPALAPLLSDKRLCGPAVQALTCIGSDQAKAALRKALAGADSTIVTGLVQALGKLRDAAAADTLLQRADSTDPDVRAAALYALANIGEPAVAPRLEAAMGSAKGFAQARAERHYLLLAQRRAEAGDVATAGVMSRRLLNQPVTPGTRHTACGALSVIVDAFGVDALADLLRAAESKDWQVRENALKLAQALPQARVSAEFAAKAAGDGDPAMRAAIVSMLSRRGDEAAVAAVLKAAGDSDPIVRRAALAAVPRLKTAAAVTPLLAAMAKGDAEDVAAAQAALTWASSPGLATAAADLLAKASVPGRIALLDLLAVRKASAQAPAVMAATADADSGVRRAALKALETLAQARELPAVITVLSSATSSSESAAAQRVVAGICSRSPAAVADVVKAHGTAAGKPRAALSGALALIGGADALQAVVADLKRPDQADKDAAVRALAGWRDLGAAPPLLELAKTSENKVHRVLALRGYVRLIGQPGGPKPARAAAMLKEAMAVAGSPADKKLVLGGLGNVRHDSAVQLAAASLADPALLEEAAAAVVKMACPRDRRDKGMKSPQAFQALTQVAKLSKNKATVTKAAAHLKSFPNATSKVPSVAKKDNLALGKPVSISCKQQGSRGPKGAVDGKLGRADGYFGDRWPSWLKVDLQAAAQIDTVRVIFYWDGKRFYTYTIDVSADGKTWTQVADNSKNKTPANADGLVHRFKPVSARYVRLNMLKNSVNEAVHIAEIEVYAAGKAPKKFKSAAAPPPPPPAKAVTPLPEPDKDGYIALFNGKDLTGWMGSLNGYDVKDGIMFCKAKGGGKLFTEHQFGDFILQFDFKLTSGANNGLAIRSPDKGNPAYAGMELQIIDTPGYEKKHKLQDWQVHGSIYGVAPAKRGALKPAGEWNHQEVRAIGPKITVILNDTTIVDTDLSKITKTADGKGLKAHPGLARHKGHLGWLGHGAHVEFRNVKIKPLEPYTAGPHNAPPEGFVPLFNGKDLSGWKGLVANPKKRAAMTPQQLADAQKKADDDMRRHWRVEDGTLVFDGKGHSLCTAKDYGDFEMLVDWKIQKGGDSGVYLRGSPQVQIWDPAKWPEGSGGLYNNKKNPRKPLACVDNPIGQWNRLRILMVGEKVTVWLNGEKVVDNVVLENYWERSKPIYPTGQLELQSHGSLLWFRNVYVREIPR